MFKKMIGIFFILLIVYFLYKMVPIINIYNINQMQYLYKSNKIFCFKKKIKLPWGLNKCEVKRIANSANWKLINEDYNSLIFFREKEIDEPVKSLSFLKDINNNIITCFFNNKDQLYIVKESTKILSSCYKNNRDSLKNFAEFEEYMMEMEKYDMYNGHIEQVAMEVFWLDEFGKAQKRVVDTFSILDVYTAMDLFRIMDLNINDYDTINFNNYVFNNNLVLRSLKRYNSTTIEQILEKYDDVNYVLEFILTNNKLLD